ncbi:MAG: phosphate regulon sensor histidine kinase PhoR [Gammaproteobacteria bacterium]
MLIWRSELTVIAFLFFGAVVFASFFGHFYEILFLIILGSLVRQLYQINRLERWLRQGGKGKYPKCKGIWEDIYYHIYRIKKSDRQRKKRLSKMVDQFRKSTAALPDAAVVLGVHDEIEWYNKAAKQVLNLKKGDRGQRIPNLVRNPEFTSYLRNRQYSKSVTIPAPCDDSILLEVRVIIYGAGMRLLLAQDVTKLKKMENMRRDFVANVSHELRTPLTVLKGYLETLKDSDEPKFPLLNNSLSQMCSQTDRMQHLVDDLLFLTRLETKSKTAECVDVMALLKQICKEGDKLGSAEGRLELSLESEAGILGDAQELRSAFTNLVVNALKYSPAEAPVKVRWHTTEKGHRLDVEDRGEGIAAEHIPRLTERFYRVDVGRSRKQGGTGLGLAIVKHVLARHGAELIIQSKPGRGSRFSCLFPFERRC